MELKEHNNFKLKYFKNIAYAFLSLIVISIDEFLKFLLELFITREKENYSNQTVLITGGANGFGKALAIEFAKLKCNIAIADIDIQNANETSQMLTDCYKIKAKAYEVDVSILEEIEKLKDRIENDLGPVDILVNNAGILATKSTIDEASPDEIRKLLDVNFTSHIWALRTFLKGMKERKKGHIIAISSISGLMALPIASGYSATKYAIKGFMESIGIELAMSGDDEFIKLMTVFPYFMYTNKQLTETITKNDVIEHYAPYYPETVAIEVIKGLLKNKKNVIVPSWYPVFVVLMNCLPNRVYRRFGKNFFNIKLTK